MGVNIVDKATAADLDYIFGAVDVGGGSLAVRKQTFANMVLQLLADGGVTTPRRKLAASEVWGLDAVNGNDATAPGDETNTAFKTGQALINHLYRNIDFGGRAINVATEGTFEENWVFDGPFVGAAGEDSLQFTGPDVGALPANFFIDTSGIGGRPVRARYGARFALNNIRLRSDPAVFYSGVESSWESLVKVFNWRWSGGYRGGAASFESAFLQAINAGRFWLRGGGRVDGSSDCLLNLQHQSYGYFEGIAPGSEIEWVGTLDYAAYQYLRNLSSGRYVSVGTAPWTHDISGATFSTAMRPYDLLQLASIGYSGGTETTFPGTGNAREQTGSVYFKGQTDQRNKSGSLTTDNSVEETVSVTVNWKPKAIFFFATVNGTAGRGFWGFMGAAAGWTGYMRDNGWSTADSLQVAHSGANVGVIGSSSGNFTTYTIVLTNDGFQLTKTKTGSPTSETVTLMWMALY